MPLGFPAIRGGVIGKPGRTRDSPPLLTSGCPGRERAQVREAVLRYCERDTWAMVRMLEKLRGLVADQLELF